METRINEILNGTGTKTSKIQKLILLGLTRRQIAILVTNNNYGFVQNVYAKMREQGLLNVAATSFMPCEFNRKFGVEFEAFNVKQTVLRDALVRAGVNCEIQGYNHRTTSCWKIVTDGSLNGVNTFELVSPILVGEAGIEELNKVCRVLKQCNAKINKSCGTHVHFDAVGFSLDTWKRLYINYARIETVIDSFMPESRRNNSYCKSLRNINDFENKINAERSVTQIANTVFDGSRYYKINPQSYSRHKTVEFRQHSGTIEFEKISNWIKFLHNLVQKSTQGYVDNGLTIEGLEQFNQTQIVDFYKQRKTKLNR